MVPLNRGVGKDSWESLGLPGENQCILKEIIPEYSLEGLTKKLKLWPPDAKNWFIWKDPNAGKDWRWEEKGTTEDKMAGWHHRLNGHEFEQAPGVGDGQGGLTCCSPWGCKELDRTERLNWTAAWEQDRKDAKELLSHASSPSALQPPCLAYGPVRVLESDQSVSCLPLLVRSEMEKRYWTGT